MIVVVKRGTYWLGPRWYIGRPSQLGNPFVIGRDGTREEVVEKYLHWFNAQLEIEDSGVGREFDRLVEFARANPRVGLECYCAPLACHGDVIKAELERHLKEVQS